MNDLDQNIHVVDILESWIVEANESEVRFQYPSAKESRGFYPYGFLLRNDQSVNLTCWYGFTAEWESVSLKPVEEMQIKVQVEFADREPLQTVITTLLQNGRATLDIPLSAFPIEEAAQNSWQYVTAVTLSWEKEGCYLSLFQAVHTRGVWMEFPIKGKAGEAEEICIYAGTAYNCEPSPVVVKLEQAYEGWESMETEIFPKDTFLLQPFQSKEIQVKVQVHEDVVPGGHENTCIRAIVNSGRDSFETRVELKTLRKLPHPYLYHDIEGWQRVRENIENVPKFRTAFQNYIETAESWRVQPIMQDRAYCYPTQEETKVMSAAYAYMLTGERKYGEKLADFFRYFTDSLNGYPVKKKGCSQSYVQEGHFFQHLAIAYDIICDADFLTETEKYAVEQSFRLYMDMLDGHLRSGRISNWLVSECMGAFYCGLVLQDMDRVLRFTFGAGGVIEQFRHGIFNDGWWHECSVGYNTWVSSMMIHMAHALLPFGYNLLHTQFRIPFNKQVSSIYAKEEPCVLSGMYNEKWGGNRKPSVCIKDMFDATIPFLDERGVLFGIADSDEKKLSGVHFGSTYDLAYTYYEDPRYIPIIKRSEADPIFGHPSLPDSALKGGECAAADNIGIAMLRSKKPGRSSLEQIQAVLRYGSHGGAHGHFDIGNLLSVMRYGRSFYNPENCWWGYAHFMYKFYVQCSMTKNMVVVDDKMQIPADSKRILFETSDHLQAAGIEVKTKWAYPPYGGMVYYQDGQTATKEELRKRCHMNGCYLPIQEGEDSPVYGEMTDYTEDILQRRVMAVTDDYIVLFDYLEGEQEHFYDNLMQIKGFIGIEGKQVEYVRHTEQMSDNPISDAQFITDCHWYRAGAETTARFETVFTEADAGEQQRCDRSNYNEPGVLKMDVHTAWPHETEQMVGRVAVYSGWAADCSGYTIPLEYQVSGDGRVLAEGAFDGWILGRDEMEADITGVRELSFAVKQGYMKNEIGRRVKTPQACFWGNMELECADGSRILVADLIREESDRIQFQNMDFGYGIGKDYLGGRVTIVGEEYPNAIPASPVLHDEAGRMILSLEGLDVIRLTACIGVDAFPGDEQQKRKTYAVRTKGRKARFVTVIEPYEAAAMVQEVYAENADCVTVWLKNGRKQTICLEGMEEGAPKVRIEE